LSVGLIVLLSDTGALQYGSIIIFEINGSSTGKVLSATRAVANQNNQAINTSITMHKNGKSSMKIDNSYL